MSAVRCVYVQLSTEECPLIDSLTVLGVESRIMSPNALAELSSEDRERVLADDRLHCDLEDQPGAIMAAIADLWVED